MNETSIAEAGNSYRRGVIFGLTMAEILLLLIFCLLLFMATLDEKIEELTKFNETLESQNYEYLRENKILLAQNARYKENIDVLGQDTSVPVEVYEVVTKMDNEELSKFVENSELASTTTSEKFVEVFEKAKQWDTVTNQPQNPKVDKISNIAKELEPEQLNKLIENAYVASQTDAEILDAALEEFNKPKEKPPEPALAPIDPKIRELAESVSLDDLKLLAEGKMEEKVEAGNNWPPIISLPEAENYSFKLGSAQLTESFKGQLSNEIVNQILRTLSEYDADLIEVIGHTDLQPMSMARVTNLDKSALEYFETTDKVSLRARDNAGLGYARALSVTKHLLQTPELKDYTILPYSAAQMVTPNHTITTKDDKFDSSQLRRIEIRVRRQNR
jgi:outer membrane protein OmpA-like peptidoglycan-associated protein